MPDETLESLTAKLNEARSVVLGFALAHLKGGCNGGKGADCGHVMCALVSTCARMLESVRYTGGPPEAMPDIWELVEQVAKSIKSEAGK